MQRRVNIGDSLPGSSLCTFTNSPVTVCHTNYYATVLSYQSQRTSSSDHGSTTIDMELAAGTYYPTEILFETSLTYLRTGYGES